MRYLIVPAKDVHTGDVLVEHAKAGPIDHLEHPSGQYIVTLVPRGWLNIGYTFRPLDPIPVWRGLGT